MIIIFVIIIVFGTVGTVLNGLEKWSSEMEIR